MVAKIGGGVVLTIVQLQSSTIVESWGCSVCEKVTVLIPYLTPCNLVR